MLTHHSPKSAKIAAEQPIVAYPVFFTESHDVPRVDALVHQLGNIGRGDVSFLSERPGARRCTAARAPMTFAAALDANREHSP